MYYLVNVDHNSMAVHLTRSDYEGFYKVLYIHCSDDILWNGSKQDGNVRTECEENEGTDCEDGDSDTEW